MPNKKKSGGKKTAKKDPALTKQADRIGQKMPSDRTSNSGPSTPGEEGSMFQPSAQP